MTKKFYVLTSLSIIEIPSSSQKTDNIWWWLNFYLMRQKSEQDSLSYSLEVPVLKAFGDGHL